jgi:hypothetical protein
MLRQAAANVRQRESGNVMESNSDRAEPIPTPKVGAIMPDGTIYAGISPDTGTPMYAMPEDALKGCTFLQAKRYAAELNRQRAHGRSDWRVPTQRELKRLFLHRRDIGGFNLTGASGAGYYWSSSHDGGGSAWEMCFSDGYQFDGDKRNESSVRCVRS